MKIYSNIETSIKTKVLCNRHLRPFDKFLIKNGNGEKLVGAEIGVLDGSHALCMLSHVPIETVYLIDPYINYPGYDDDYATVGLNEYCKQAEKTLKYFIKNGKAVFVKSKFQDAVDIVPDNLDFVYYDIYDNIDRHRKYFALYFPKIHKGGFIAGHNFDGFHNGVARAVLDFADKNNLSEELDGIDDDWWITKK